MAEKGLEIDGQMVTIRSVTDQDLAFIIDIDSRSTGSAKPKYWRELFARYQRRDEDQYFLVAEGGGEVLGFIVGETRAWVFGAPLSGWIFSIDVVPEARVHKVGTALLNRILDAFRADGITSIRTTVSRNNTLILSFFRSQGMMASPYIQLEMTLDETEGAAP